MTDISSSLPESEQRAQSPSVSYLHGTLQGLPDVYYISQRNRRLLTATMLLAGLRCTSGLRGDQQAQLANILTACTPCRCHDARASWRVGAGANGSVGQSSQHRTDQSEAPVTSTVEMFIMDGPPTVSLDEEDGASAVATPARPPGRHTRRVAPPRAKPLPNTSLENSHPAALQHITQSAQTKKLRVELGMAQSELHDKQLELRQSKATTKHQDRELARLRAALAERDVRLQESKVETSAARSAVQAKEGEMQDAYQRLTAACSERSSIRKALIDSQAEAAALRTELQAWTQDLFKLRDILDSLYESEEGTPSTRPVPKADALAQLENAASNVKPSDKGEDDAMKLLRDLSDLSQQLAADAKEDEEIFAQSAAASRKNSQH